jgi:hypothetical protein
MIGVAGFALALAVAPGAVAQVAVDYGQPNHLECYQIKDVKDLGTTYTLNIDSLDETLLPPNTFSKSCTFKRFSRDYCVAATTHDVVPTPPSESDLSDNGAVPQAFDYICYNVRCTQQDQPGLGQEVLIKDRFGGRDVRVIKMKKLCVPILSKGPSGS